MEGVGNNTYKLREFGVGVCILALEYFTCGSLQSPLPPMLQFLFVSWVIWKRYVYVHVHMGNVK